MLGQMPAGQGLQGPQAMQGKGKAGKAMNKGDFFARARTRSNALAKANAQAAEFAAADDHDGYNSNVSSPTMPTMPTAPSWTAANSSVVRGVTGGGRQGPDSGTVTPRTLGPLGPDRPDPSRPGGATAQDLAAVVHRSPSDLSIDAQTASTTPNTIQTPTTSTLIAGTPTSAHFDGHKPLPGLPTQHQLPPSFTPPHHHNHHLPSRLPVPSNTTGSAPTASVQQQRPPLRINTQVAFPGYPSQNYANHPGSTSSPQVQTQSPFPLQAHSRHQSYDSSNYGSEEEQEGGYDHPGSIGYNSSAAVSRKSSLASLASGPRSARSNPIPHSRGPSLSLGQAAQTLARSRTTSDHSHSRNPFQALTPLEQQSANVNSSATNLGVTSPSTSSPYAHRRGLSGTMELNGGLNGIMALAHHSRIASPLADPMPSPQLRSVSASAVGYTQLDESDDDEGHHSGFFTAANGSTHAIGYAKLEDNDDEERLDDNSTGEHPRRTPQRSDTYTALPARGLSKRSPRYGANSAAQSPATPNKDLSPRSDQNDLPSRYGLGTYVQSRIIHAASPPPMARTAPLRHSDATSIGMDDVFAGGLGNLGMGAGANSSIFATLGLGSTHNMDGAATLSSSTSTSLTATSATSATTTLTVPTYGSDEMLMALLASQAAVDCESLSVGSWDEVEGWKKQLAQLTTRLESLQTRLQRDLKILTAARTLEKLNKSNKRVSRQTMANLEDTERRVEAAEKEILVTRDRESVLRRKLMEHWSGVMAWEVRRLERSAAEQARRVEAQLQALAAAAAHNPAATDPELMARLAIAEEERDANASRVRQLETEHQGKMRQLEDLHAGRIREFESERETMSTSSAATSDQIRTLTNARDGATSRVKELEAQIAKMTEHTDSLSREKSTWETERDRMFDSHAAARGEWETVREDLERQHADVSAKVVQMETDNDQLQSRNRELESRYQQLQSMHQQLESQHGDLQSTHSAVQQRLGDLEASHTDLQAQRGDLQDQLGQKGAMEARFQEVRTELLQLTTAHTKLKSEHDQATATRGQLESDHGDLQKQHDALGLTTALLQKQHDELSITNSILQRERDDLQTAHERLQLAHDQLNAKHDQIVSDFTQLTTEHAQLKSDHEEAGAAHRLFGQVHEEASKANATRTALVAGGIGAILGRGTITDDEMPGALEELRSRFAQHDTDLATLRDQMKTVNGELEAELRNITFDRDNWKSKAEEAERQQAEKPRELPATQPGRSMLSSEMMEFTRKIRNQGDQIISLTKRNAELEGRNEELENDLTAAYTENAIRSGRTAPLSAKKGTGDASNKDLEDKVAALEKELATTVEALKDTWILLPQPKARAEAGLSTPSVVSPNAKVNFAALQRAYAGPTLATRDNYGGVAAFTERVYGLVEDGRLLVERMARMEVDKERHKANAAKAARLVQDSRTSLETYHKQVAELQERLRQKERMSKISRMSRSSMGTTAAAENAAAELELEKLRSLVEASHGQNARLEADLATKESTIERLNEVNSTLSTRTLHMAEDAEADKRALQSRLQREIDELRKELRKATENADEELARSQSQRIQLLDEMNSLQAEVAELRQKLRK